MSFKKKWFLWKSTNRIKVFINRRDDGKFVKVENGSEKLYYDSYADYLSGKESQPLK